MEHNQTTSQTPSLLSRWRIATLTRLRALGAAVVLITCALLGLTGTLGTAYVAGNALESGIAWTRYEIITPQNQYANSPIGELAARSSLSSVFTPEVHYWEPLIQAWAVIYQIDPNLIATVIQIESCGDPTAHSPAGAQGLFQVMPFHFADGEDMLDVQTNAQRGLNYLTQGLLRADGHAGLALAGYNGGHGVINRGWNTWPAETQRYYYWGARIYEEARSGQDESPTLTEWLNAGGSGLCSQANLSISRLESQHQQARAVAAAS